MFVHIFLFIYTNGSVLYILFNACVLSLISHVRLIATLWTVAHQAPLSMGFSRQEYWSGLHLLTAYQFSSVQLLSRVRLFVTLWTVAHQAPLSVGFSRQEYWSGLPFPSPVPYICGYKREECFN